MTPLSLMRSVWLAAALCFLLVLGTVLAQDEAFGPSSLEESQCYDCHARGGGGLGPPMDQIVASQPLVGDLEQGALNFRVEVYNTWVSELRDINTVLDIRRAPSFKLGETQPPVTTTSEQTYPPATNLDPRTEVFQFEVLVGASGLSLLVEPTSSTSSDYRVELWAPGRSMDGPPTRTLDGTGVSGEERLQIEGPEVIQTFGYGLWNGRIVLPGLLEDLTGALAEQSTRVEVTNSFAPITETELFVAYDGVLDGQDASAPQIAEIDFPLFLEQLPLDGEVLEFTVRTEAYYDHPASITNVDHWIFEESNQFTIRIDSSPPPIQGNGTATSNSTSAPTIRLEGQDTVPTPGSNVVRETTIGMDSIGEVVGYVTGFTMLISFVTGGLFGRTNKRVMNKLLGNAKRRVAFHNLSSYLLLILALVHTVLFLIEPAYPWQLGFFLGNLSLLGLYGLAVTGSLQVPIIRKSSFKSWKAWHLVFSFLAILAAVAHVLLDGPHFESIQEAVNWQDPVRPFIDPIEIPGLP